MFEAVVAARFSVQASNSASCDFCRKVQRCSGNRGCLWCFEPAAVFRVFTLYPQLDRWQTFQTWQTLLIGTVEVAVQNTLGTQDQSSPAHPTDVLRDSMGFHGIPSICQRMSMNLRCCPNWQGTRGTRPTCKTFATDFRTVKVRVCHAHAHARSISFMCLHLFHECSVSCVQMLQTVKHLPRRTSQNCGSLWPISRSRASPGNGRNFGHFVKQSPCYRHLTKSYLFLGKNNDAESRSWHAGCTREWHYKRVENQYFHPPRSIVFHLFLKSKMHGYTFIEDSVPCRKAFRHDLGMTSWIQRLQWIQW